MKPALALPLNDPDGTMFLHLQAMLPDLKAHFDKAFLTIPNKMQVERPENVRTLERDNFFELFAVDSDAPIGDHFAFLYSRAAFAVPSEKILHLCYPDRLSFALRTEYREEFLDDIDSLTFKHLPLIFHRSSKAWATHPQNYFELESFVTRVGETLFGKTLDYAWCHFVIQAGHLREIMPRVKRHDLSMVAEMILYIQENVKTREVDWLAWEDPFLLGRDAAELKEERENSLVETRKRLSYVLPMTELLMKFATNGKG